ncbi:hypothetical protein EC988_009623, partial [Linderina pennispora]
MTDSAYDGYGQHPALLCSAAPVIYRDLHLGTRQTCDVCRTTITAVYLSCSSCALEVCHRCFAEWDDTDVTHRVSHSIGVPGGVYTAETRPKDIAKCKRITNRMVGLPVLWLFHRKSQFVRVSQYTPADVEFISERVHAVAQNGHADIPPATDEVEIKIRRIQQRTREQLSLADWELAPLYVDKDELTADEFSL